MEIKVNLCLLFAQLVLHMPTIMSHHDKHTWYSLPFTDHAHGDDMRICSANIRYLCLVQLSPFFPSVSVLALVNISQFQELPELSRCYRTGDLNQ